MMKLIPTEVLPKKKCARHDLQGLIHGFVDGGDNIVRVDITETDYKSPRVCYSCMTAAVRRSGYPVKVRIRNSQVYLVKC